MKKITKKILKARERRRIKRDKKEAWKIARQRTLERDNFKCLVCERDLSLGNVHNQQVHHLLDKKNYPQFSLMLDNLTVLCYRDHKVGPCSPHLNAFMFMEIFKKKKPEQYIKLLELMKLC